MMEGIEPLSTTIIFEHGLELSRERHSLELPPSTHAANQAMTLVREKYGVRPVLFSLSWPWGKGRPREEHNVMSLDGQRMFNYQNALPLRVRLEGLQHDDRSLRYQMNARYTAGAVLHHFQMLAYNYINLIDRGVSLREEWLKEQQKYGWAGDNEPYYEAEALITAARRTYDSLRYILWKTFGFSNSSTPTNFHKTVAACKDIPENLRTSLQTSWNSYGEKMTDYRDCIHHYVPFTSKPTAWLWKVEGDHWCVRLGLPDNPEARSQRAFKYDKNIELLTYCWELTNEVFRVAEEVFAAIPI